jgi:hypothetical protein
MVSLLSHSADSPGGSTPHNALPLRNLQAWSGDAAGQSGRLSGAFFPPHHKDGRRRCLQKL